MVIKHNETVCGPRKCFLKSCFPLPFTLPPPHLATPRDFFFSQKAASSPADLGHSPVSHLLILHCKRQNFSLAIKYPFLDDMEEREPEHLVRKKSPNQVAAGRKLGTRVGKHGRLTLPISVTYC